MVVTLLCWHASPERKGTLAVTHIILKERDTKKSPRASGTRHEWRARVSRGLVCHHRVRGVCPRTCAPRASDPSGKIRLELQTVSGEADGGKCLLRAATPAVWSLLKINAGSAPVSLFQATAFCMTTLAKYLAAQSGVAFHKGLRF